MSGASWSTSRSGGLAGILFVSLSALQGDAQEPPHDFFEKNIRPVLVEHCYKCHSAKSEKLKGGLRLDTPEAMLKGGESGKPAIVPGDAEASLLIEAIRYGNEDLQMPPKTRLNEQQVAHFVQWINIGAPDPRTNGAIAAATSGANHWAFQPPKAQALPTVKNAAWP